MIEEKENTKIDYDFSPLGITTELKWLLEESKAHSSFDTLAKKYYLNGEYNKGLNRLKKILILYFFFEQWVNYGGKNDGYTITDLRYDNLMASLLEKNGDEIILKKNVKFITWNYDLQFEKSLVNFINKVNCINCIKEKFKIIPNHLTFDKKPEEEKLDQNIIKLNGNAFADTTHDIYDFKKVVEIYDNQKYFENLEDFFKDPNNSSFNLGTPMCYFNFAWEEPEKNLLSTYKNKQWTVDVAKEIMKSADHLIIVGYSFPYLNRSIDSQLFEGCKPTKITIQDLEPERVLERLKKINFNMIEACKDHLFLEKASNYFPSPD